MEIFEGHHNTLILYDSSPFDIESLERVLHFQFSSNEYQNDDKVVVLDLSEVEEGLRQDYIGIAKKYAPKQVYIFNNDLIPEELMQLQNKSILYKGMENTPVGQFFLSIKNRKHKTWIEFDLSAIEKNIETERNKLPANTKILVMVKASSYGTGDVRIPHFLQQIGIDYLGVAFVDEGVILRENRINLPIFVINTEIDSFEDIVDFNLEPAIFSFEQLQSLCRFLKQKKITDFPIHIATETGMNRLGFNIEDCDELISFIQNAPEVKLKGVYSHLADADNNITDFTEEQILRFLRFKEKFEAKFSYKIIFHLLNSEGVSRFGKKAGFDMARLGIGIYGYTSNAKKDGLLTTLQWNTTISQIKSVKKGETIGYGRSYTAHKDMRIATLLVGYADGFSRKLSNGIGQVFINNMSCPVVGNVCMDMTMVDVTQINCKEGDIVEIIGAHISMELFAERLDTIIHEAMTRIDKRVAKVYLRD